MKRYNATIIEFKELRVGDGFFIDNTNKYRVVREIIYSGGGRIGWRSYEGVYIILTQCGCEILATEKSKFLIAFRYDKKQKLTKINHLVREARD